VNIAAEHEGRAAMPSNAKPGGRLLHIAQLVFSNATGFTVFEYAIAAKWLEHSDATSVAIGRLLGDIARSKTARK
jgi:hypothetical protein